MNINNEKMEKLLKDAGLPLDMRKIIGAKVMLNYASDKVETGFHLFSQITGVMMPYDQFLGYSFLRITLTTQQVLSGARIVYLQFEQQQGWSLTIEGGVQGELDRQLLLVPTFWLLGE